MMKEKLRLKDIKVEYLHSGKRLFVLYGGKLHHTLFVGNNTNEAKRIFRQKLLEGVNHEDL